MNWACDNSHKPIDIVPVSSVLGKYTIQAIKQVLLQNMPKKLSGYMDLFQLYWSLLTFRSVQ